MRIRYVLATTVSLLAICIGVIGCGDGDGKTATTGPAGGAISGEFVGESGDYFVAAIADNQAAKRTVRLYLCNGNGGVTEWFPGVTSDANKVGFTSEDGKASANLTFAGDRASGTATVPGGKSVEFSLARARGLAGLYNVSYAADGNIAGKSVVGERTITGKRGDQAMNGEYPVMITVSGGGESAEQKAYVPNNEAAELRLIFIPGSERKGLGGGTTSSGKPSYHSWTVR